MTIPIVHAITTDEILARADFVDRAVQVMRALGPRGALHLRARNVTARRVCALVETLEPWQRETGTWLVINDRVDIALGTGARGVQLTERSLTPSQTHDVVRRAGAALAVGVSVHTVPAAVAAAHDGADWLMAGHIFDTPSHAETPGHGVALLDAIVALVPTPVIVIGGIRPDDVPSVRATGAHGIATIRGLWETVDAGLACDRYLSLYDGTAADRRPRERGAVSHGEW